MEAAAGAVFLALLVLLAVAGAGLAPGPFAGRDRPTASANGLPVTSPGVPTSTSNVDSTTSAPSGDAVGGLSRAARGASRPAPVDRSRYVGFSPTCERPPDLVLVVILGALEHNDPATDDGIRTAWNFSARTSPGSSYRSFARNLGQPEFDPLFTHRTVEYAVEHVVTGIVSYRVRATTIDGRQSVYTVVLERQEVGTREGCWLLAGFLVDR